MAENEGRPPEYPPPPPLPWPPPPPPPLSKGAKSGRFVAGVFAGLLAPPLALAVIATQSSTSAVVLVCLFILAVPVIALARRRKISAAGRHFVIGVVTGFCLLLLVFGVCFAVVITHV